MSPIDFGRHSEDYAAHRPGPPASFYQRIDAIARLRESRSLDLATGPGTIALELGARGSSVVGVDTSAEQIATAQRLARERHLEDTVRFRVARAEDTGLEASSFDLATAGQCWHWFDRGAAMAEILRVLRPNGVLAIVDYSYLAEHSPVARDTEKLILELNPSWTMAGSTGISPERIDEVIHGGFRLVEQFCYHHDEEFSHARWRGRMRTCNGVGSGGLSPSEVPRFDDALGRLLREKYPDPMVIEHRVWCVVARSRRMSGSGGRYTVEVPSHRGPDGREVGGRCAHLPGLGPRERRRGADPGADEALRLRERAARGALTPLCSVAVSDRPVVR